jgi:protein O-GlcNAc transferase
MSRKRKKKQKRRLSSGNRRSVRKKLPVNRHSFDIESKLRKADQYYQSGQLQEAASIYKKVLKMNPNHSHSLNLLGIIAHHGSNNDMAVRLISRAVQNDPANPTYHNNLGNAFKEQGKLREAVSCYQKALKLKPDYAAPYNNMGNALQNLGKLKEAISCHQKTIQLKPDYVGAYNNIGNAFYSAGNLDEAVSWYEKALHLEPHYPEAYNNMGNAFQDQGKLNEAISCYENALQLHPDFAEPFVQLVRVLQQTCAWQELQGMTPKLDSLTKTALENGTKPVESPFFSITRQADLSRHFAVARSWSLDIAKTVSNLSIHFSFDHRRLDKGKIAVGYLSHDFCDHATAHLMLSLFGLHNRDEFGIYCYSYGPDDRSYYKQQIQRDCDKFVDVRDLSYADAAERIYDDQIDILVDLKGYTQNSRLAICALRPAPVQVSYLGFPGTTGADFFDYMITDRIVTPEDHAPYYSESFVYLPHCYQVNDHTQAISDKNLEKEDCGLPQSSFVFCSFNLPYKVDPVMFDVWMKILRQVPEGVLWLLWGSEGAEKSLRQEAETRGVRAERLIFGKKLPKDEHVARLRLSDLALDTRIVNGHTTTSDALWAGVPVITLMGAHFASRVSSSILTAIGLPEFITHGLEEYEALAVHLAQNPDELKAIRQRLETSRLKEPLFDTPRFVGNLEKAYKEMWNIFVARERPRAIEVTEEERIE